MTAADPDRLQPHADVPRAWVSEVTFSDGTAVQFGHSDIVVVVGANNAGKSAALRGIRDKFQNSSHVSPVVRSIRTERSGTVDQVIEWLRGWAIQQSEQSPADPIFMALGHAVHQSGVRGTWGNNSNFDGLSRWFCHLLGAEERLQISNPAPNIALARDNPSHPVHFMLRDDGLERALSAQFRRAFDVDLIVHRNAGNQVPLHVGERPQLVAGEDRVSLSYIERLEKLPTLHSQGDGMRSFAGVLLASSVGRESVMLVDEPEAFLHPPQAKLLGTTLVQQRKQGRQLFIATHSSDVLRGLLDTGSRDIRVIRLRRTGTTNSVRLLTNERIRELWGDPLLRYSNILDGLFHEQVFVCEGDADCRFYSAVRDVVVSSDAKSSLPRDVMFTHCGGKARLPLVIRALREVDVPVRAVADFDVLSEEEPLKSIVESLGMLWSRVEADWRAVSSAIASRKPDLSSAEIARDIGSILAGVTAPQFPATAKAAIQAVLKRSSPWANAKLVGKAFVPAGDAAKACERLLGTLREAGLHIVEVGELEGFVRTESGHGPKWVNSVLARELASDPELDAARNFVRRMISVE